MTAGVERATAGPGGDPGIIASSGRVWFAVGSHG